MFSLVNSSCSTSKDSEPRADERDSDQLPAQEANPFVRFEPQTTNFSIRDHVLSSRSKNIIANWPFPSKFLQICLKNGIRDILPPFKSQTSVRSALKFTTAAAQLEQTTLPDGSPVVEPELQPKTVQKAGAISEEVLEREVMSSASMSSDILASKTCPVCKVFSSTSNTTLNAHMDQCLSVDSDATLSVEIIQRTKPIKPRKKRFMEDIYATALFSSLQDLDRRNGTSWATDSNAAALAVEKSNSEAKKPKLAVSDARDDSNDGAVYVDSNGIKIRILSKFNDAPHMPSGEGYRPRKSEEGVGDTKSNFKKMKLKMRNKKVRSLKLFENEVQALPPGVSHHQESHMEEERSPVHLSEKPDKVLNCGSTTLKNWHSSKRSELPKKLGKKDYHKIVKHFKSATEAASAPKCHFGKLSRLSESKPSAFSSHTVQNFEVEKTSTNYLRLRLSRVLGTLASSSRRGGEEFCVERKQEDHALPKLHKRSAEAFHPLPKTKKMSTISTLSNVATKMGKNRTLLSWTDMQTKTSNGEVDQNRSLGTSTRASLENTDNCSINLKSLVDEGQNQACPMVPIGTMVQIDKQALDQLESSACLTSPELSLDIPLKKFLISSDHLLPVHGNNLAGEPDPSVSPASCASTISPASPDDQHSIASEIKPTSCPSKIQENLSLELPFMMSKNGNHKADIGMKPCCCSWQSFMDGNMKKKPLSNLCIEPSMSCFYAFSNLRMDALPSMESPTESILTKAFSDVGSASPSCGTPTQSSSGSVLRLMGKDLMVVNNAESAHTPKVHSPCPTVPNHDTFSFSTSNQTTSMINSRELSMNQKAYVAKEMMIDDSHEICLPKDGGDTFPHPVFQRPFSYFQPLAHVYLTDNDITKRPSLINHGSLFPASYQPGSFVFQSPSPAHLNSQFHYSHSFR